MTPVRRKAAIWWGETWDFDVTHEASDGESTCITQKTLQSNPEM